MDRDQSGSAPIIAPDGYRQPKPAATVRLRALGAVAGDTVAVRKQLMELVEIGFDGVAFPSFQELVDTRPFVDQVMPQLSQDFSWRGAVRDSERH